MSEKLDNLKDRSLYFKYNNKKNSIKINYILNDNNKKELRLQKISIRACKNIMKKIKQNYNKINPKELIMLLEIMNV